ncbi:NADH dehydrogenase [ubiquinone] 1 beta subcomplex subunit 2, mitochondrial isoform X1 [Kryptolebias marmoratus]|uniref:NADH dehydrogenase [ubiquinone] 1 beta subcomplex subunit 2, mitochondrial n=1 Tax=Kryptolebias marmoratus TaxID=37003 RepID=A0A3Q3FQ50_KRYMA|nr:NADH dehydrogenase [ubiquinone] 1 beta subcomplex subunit 2, mitochondrial isoform X1 [Kryptolebias marmoratus]XP_017267165.1 NADH dehydrogenase [ubiquinone] 1 beta subcomplex subunit 2, mitochondrial isoform X2 [Kryptolebias marmoratus]XP_017267166.1 NADH dehydrogenase [ubiquinone] 1 beta subcomplex subunit 2, mitochondrial isoform X1 [Kryptolebias marmoratus]
MSSIGRAFAVLRTGTQLLRCGPRRIQSRKASDVPHIEPRYRQFPQLTKKQQFDAEVISGLMWFWILWHFWHDSDAVLGHFPWPDPSQWTDEELGIPPDDEE